MAETIDFAGDPHVGVFARVFDDIAVVPPQAPEPFVQAIAGTMDVEIVQTTIQGSAIIGSLLAGNTRGVVVSGLASSHEVETLREYREVMLLSKTMNAAGNVILANDHIAAIHPGISDREADKIAEVLGVPVIRLTLGGIPTVGMAAVATNNGIMVHPRSSMSEIAALEEAAGLRVGTGSVNMGVGLVGTGLLVNSSGYLAGMHTTGFELGRIEEVFGFLE